MEMSQIYLSAEWFGFDSETFINDCPHFFQSSFNPAGNVSSFLGQTIKAGGFRVFVVV